ncbi:MULTISPECIES: hypothetical protein [Vibrio harveyi group]|uniref:hypothetical protein n=1 Tax=Vibrio harveyi group TaxID=717610 RepID=UPI0011109762|nr:hypothetical protein [Vibrio parahaemolyticus]MDG2761621.1 hypothetical protein [Vibrio parahaemolyticus]TMX40870.1 hypothetical protein DA098_03300 [Vibrio parahaemolyticus]TMX79825.1 hypothetical protein DA094_04900 [Vibrio parahaemolyticus]
MSALSGLYPLVRQRCAGVMDLMMDDALRDSYREFCEKSQFITNKTVLSDVYAGIERLVVPAPNHAVLKVESVTNHEKGPVSLYQFNPVSSEITFDESHGEVVVVAVLKPKLGFTDSELNEYLVNNYAEALAAGAAYRLRMQVGTDWFNPELATFYEREFVEGCRRAYLMRREEFVSFKNNVRKRNFY